MGKKSRARVAAAGTRKDPGRRVAEGKKADRAEKDKKVGAHAHPEWAPHLNSASEDLTAKLFTLVEVILGVVPLVVIGLFLASKDATRDKGFPALRPGVESSHARYRKADNKFVCRPFGAALFVWGPGLHNFRQAFG